MAYKFNPFTGTLDYYEAVAIAADIIHIYNEDLTSRVNGSTTHFPTSKTFVAGTTRVFLNGQRQKLGLNYTENGTTGIIMSTAPSLALGEQLTIDYDYLLADQPAENDLLLHDGTQILLHSGGNLLLH